MTRHLIKVFGERNTGTRAILQMIRAVPTLTTANPALRKPPALKALQTRIEDRLRGRMLSEYMEALNFDNRKRVGGVAAWKHTAPLFDDSFAKSKAHVIMSIRNPYSWLISLKKHPYHAQGKSDLLLEQFTDHPWLTLPKDRVASVLESPMCLWNEKLRAYISFLELCDVPVALFKFEEFVHAPVDTLSGAIAGFGIDPAGLAELPFSTKDENQTVDDLREYYAAEKWRLLLTRQSVSLINSFTDWDIANHFGYKMLNPKDFPIALAETS